MGFEVIPKLNFSTTHDTWLGEYALMVSTSVYYRVCKELIDEVCELFQPRFLHLGMDEEVYENQKDYDYVVIRQNDLWWKDFYYLVDCVEQHGYDQLPCGSVEYFVDNLELLAKYCVKKISREHLFGFAQTTWEAVQPEWVEMLDQGADTMKAVREWYEKEGKAVMDIDVQQLQGILQESSIIVD